MLYRGKFKSFRTDRVIKVLEQLTTGHPSSLHAAVCYADRLPAFPVASAVYRIATTAHSSGPART